MKAELKPSKIYWVVDTLSGEDFDRRKLEKNTGTAEET